MGILALGADERVADVVFTADTLNVTMKDGRTITVPLAWYPRLLQATSRQRKHWKISGGGYGIHWPELDEDLSTEGLLRGAPAPRTQAAGKKEVRAVQGEQQSRIAVRNSRTGQIGIGDSQSGRFRKRNKKT